MGVILNIQLLILCFQLLILLSKYFDNPFEILNIDVKLGNKNNLEKTIKTIEKIIIKKHGNINKK